MIETHVPSSCYSFLTKPVDFNMIIIVCMFKIIVHVQKGDNKDRQAKFSGILSQLPSLAHQSRQRSRRRRFEHKECFTESASPAGKAVFFSKERASLVCGDFCVRD